MTFHSRKRLRLESTRSSRRRSGGWAVPYAWLSLGVVLLFACNFITEGVSPTPVEVLVPPTYTSPAAQASPLVPTATQVAPTPVTPLPSPTAQPPPPSPTPQTIRFAVIGDYGQGDRNAGDVAELVKSWNPDFIITTGDNNYPSGAAATIDQNIGQFYHEFIFPYMGAYGPGAERLRFFPTLGNHDWDSARARPYLDYFELPGNERYYDFVWEPVHFFALSTDSREPDRVGASSAQAQWLKQRLAASTAPWKLVYGHHPPYSSGPRGPVDWMRWPFKEWGASIYLAGHDHYYERLLVDGFPYLINGIGGGPIYGFGPIDPGSLVRFNADYGAMLVVADSQQVTFQFITRHGEVIDTYQLTR